MIELIYCVTCKDRIKRRLTDGAEIYPHRPDLSDLPFWKCDKCGNYVGCHYKTKDRTNPTGCIANKEIKDARVKIHGLLDPIWQSGRITRKALYKMLSEKLKRPYHTGHIRSIEEAREAYKLILKIKEELK